MYVNTDMIAYIEMPYKTDEKCLVSFKDGTSTYVKGMYVDELLGEDCLLQVLPVKEPLIAIYDEFGASKYEEDIYYLGLFADGSVKPLTLVDGEYHAVSDSDNCVGVFPKNENWRERKEE